MANESERTEHTTNDDESFANLMKLAGERPEIPLSVESRVYHQVQQEWKRTTVEPSVEKVYEKVHRTWRREALRGRILRWLVPAGIAASAVIAMMVVSQPELPAAQVAGTISRVVGADSL